MTTGLSSPAISVCGSRPPCRFRAIFWLDTSLNYIPSYRIISLQHEWYNIENASWAMGGCLLKWMQIMQWLDSKSTCPLFFTDMHDETLEKRERRGRRGGEGRGGLGGWSSVLGFYFV